MTVLQQVLLASRISQSAAMDNAIAIAELFGWEGGSQVMLGVCADYSIAVAAVKTLVFKRGAGVVKTGPMTTSTLARGSTDTKVATTIFEFAIEETTYAKAAVAAGTTLAAGTIPTNKWGIYLLSINAAGTIAVTAGAANFSTGYASEAAAIVGLPSTPASSASIGYFTVLTAVGSPFVGGTDALEGGASGAPSSDTNYYSTASVAPGTEICTLKWDFTNGPCWLSLPGALRGDSGGSVSCELQASGAGGTTGHVVLFGFSK